MSVSIRISQSGAPTLKGGMAGAVFGMTDDGPTVAVEINTDELVGRKAAVSFVNGIVGAAVVAFRGAVFGEPTAESEPIVDEARAFSDDKVEEGTDGR